MDPVTIGSAITAAGTAIAGGASAVASSKLNKKTMKFNREEAEKQRAWNESMYDKQNAWNYEMWLKQNEYNSPTEQIKRLQDAGLNPLYYGLDGSSAGEITAAQPLNYDRASMDSFANPVESALSGAAAVAQIGNIRADTAKKSQETLSEVTKREQMIQQIENAKQELVNLKSEKGLTDARIREIEAGLSWLDRINTATVAEKESRVKLSNSQSKRIEELLEGEKLYQAKSIEDFEYKWNSISAQIRKMSAETNLLYEDLENYALNHANNGFMGTGVSLPNFIRLLFSGRNKNDKHDSKAFTDNLDDLNELRRSGQ